MPALETAGVSGKDETPGSQSTALLWFDYLRAFAGVRSPVLVIQSQCDTPHHRIRTPPVAAFDDFPELRFIQVSSKPILEWAPLRRN